MVSGPWDWYAEWAELDLDPAPDVMPETLETPHLQRIGTIYLDDAGPGPYVADGSYSEWFVTIPNTGRGTYFQYKKQIGSIASLGVTGSEIVYDRVIDVLSIAPRMVLLNYAGTSGGAADWTVPGSVTELTAVICFGPGGGGAGSANGGENGGGGGGGVGVVENIAVTPASLITYHIGAGGAGGSSASGGDGSADTVWDVGGDDLPIGEYGTGGTNAAAGVGGGGSGDFSFTGGNGYRLGSGSVGGGGGGGAGSDGNGTTATSATGGAGGAGVFDPLGEDRDAGGAGGNGGDGTDGGRGNLRSGGGGGGGNDMKGGDGANGFIAVLFTGEYVEDATIRVNAGTEVVSWIVMDSDWEQKEWEPIGAIPINVFDGSGVLTLTDPLNNSIADAVGACVHSGGLRRWNVSFETLESEDWNINGLTGGYTYELTEDWFDVLDDDPAYYTYTHTGPYNTDDDTLIQFTSAKFPVCQAPQANYALGWDMPHEAEYPADETAYFARGWTIFPRIEIYIGEYGLNAGDNYPTINGTLLWDFDAPETGEGPFGAVYEPIRGRIDNFDASDSSSVMIVSYRYVTEWIAGVGISVADVVRGTTSLVINGADTPEIIFEATDASGTPDYTSMYDQRDFYPKWYTPRCLHSTESAQGGGDRVIVFHRCPFDQPEADTEVANYPFGFEGNTSLRQTRMVCYKDGVFNHDFVSRRAASAQASGDITITATSDVLYFTATQGGDADGHIYGLGSGATVSFSIIDGTPEKAEYVASTRTLTVTLDITGGNNTIGDLRAVIDAGGDWTVTWTSTPNDTGIVTAATTGSGTLAGGAGGGSGTITHYVHDSSDRFYYVANFRMRIRELVGTRWQTTYHEGWRISHDGSSVSPWGIGARQDRGSTGTGPGWPAGDQTYSCIKNNGLIPLGPSKGQI